MQDEKNKVEAVLFTTGKFISLEELGKLSGIGSIGFLKEVVQELKKEYSSRESALEIIEQGERFKLNIRKPYLYLTESLLNDSELDKPTQETLAVIAYKNPALQSEIIRIRGNGAYDHIKTLKELDFVNSIASGRTFILKLTTKFYDYFDVVENQLRTKMNVVENRIQEGKDAALEQANNEKNNSNEEPVVEITDKVEKQEASEDSNEEVSEQEASEENNEIQNQN